MRLDTLKKYTNELKTIVKDIGFDTIFTSKSTAINGGRLRRMCEDGALTRVGKDGVYITYKLSNAHKDKVDKVIK